MSCFQEKVVILQRRKIKLDYEKQCNEDDGRMYGHDVLCISECAE